MSIATFADLAASPTANKDFLITIQPREWHSTWTKTGGYTNTYEVAWAQLFDPSAGLDGGGYGLMYRALGGVMENSVAYTVRASIALVDANAGSYFLDTAANKLYVHAFLSADPNSSSLYICSRFTIYTASGIAVNRKGKIFNNVFYEPIFDAASIPAVEAEQTDFLAGGGIAVSSVRLEFRNHFRFWDAIIDTWIWKNAPVFIYFGGEYLPIGEYTMIFSGKIIDERWNEDVVSFDCVDNFDMLKRNVPVNPLFGATVVEEDSGKPIPICFGSVSSIRPLCVDQSVPAASVWQIADPDYQTLSDILNVYDDGVDVTSYVTKDLTGCKFTFSGYTPTGEIRCDARGAKISDIPGESDGSLMTNASDIVRWFLKRILKLTDDDLDLTSFSNSKAETSDVELAKYVRYRRNLSSYIQEIERSVFGALNIGTDGKFRFDIFSPVFDDSESVENYEIERPFQRESPLSKMYSGVRVFFKPTPIERPEGAVEGEDDSFSVVQADNPRSLYVENQEATYKSVATWIVDQGQAASLCQRISWLTNQPVVTVETAIAGIKMFRRRPGDIIRLYKKIATGAAGTIDGDYYQIISIGKEFANNRAEVKLEGFKGATFNVGIWMSDAAPTWAAATPAERDVSGFWTDDNGLADPGDPTSKNVSLWW